MVLPVTMTVICVWALSIFFITGWIGARRAKVDVLRGDGGDTILFKRIRIHGNLMENAPVFIFSLASAELLGLAKGWLWAAFGLFLLGRLLHFKLYDSNFRGGAMFVTVLPGMVMAGWILLKLWF